MPNPTPTIFVPYHAIDDLHRIGTRALQPTATAVTPGTLYCVTDESNKVERSSGLVWEAYGGGGGAVPPNIAFTNVQNIFTVPEQNLIAPANTYALWNSQDITSSTKWGAGTIGSHYAVTEYGTGKNQLVITKTTGQVTVIGGIASVRGAVSALHATPTTIFTFPASYGAHLVHYYMITSDPANYSGLALLLINGSVARLVVQVAANFIVPSMSGLSLQVTQNSGVTFTVNMETLKIF
jgi:hypothetical protein